MKNLAVLGSTGSVGTSTLDVVRQNRDLFNVEVLLANSNFDLMMKQYEGTGNDQEQVDHRPLMDEPEE